MKREKHFKIISKGGVGEFSILDHRGDYVTVFSYKGWFSSSGTAPTPNGLIKVKAIDQWGTSFTMAMERKKIGEILFNWRGNVVISLREKSKVHQFLLQHEEKSPLWTLSDEDDHEILTMRAKSHWAKTDHHYDVRVPGKPGVNLTNLLVACGFACNLNQSKVTGLMA